MSDYLKKTKRAQEEFNLRDYSLSNNNIDDEYTAMLGEMTVAKITRLINKYPDYKYTELKRALKRSFGISKIVLGNGSEDLIIRINSILRNNGEVAICLPNFYRIAETVGKYKKIHISYNLNSNLIDYTEISNQLSNKVKSVWISNPNPMIGKACKKEKLISLIKKHKRILFIIDESAIDFIKDSRIYSVIDFAQKTDNLIVLRSFSKLYGIVGLRVGFATGKTKILEKIEKIGLTFPVNGVAEYFVRELLTKRPIVNNIRKKISLHKYLIGKILAKNPNIILSKSVTNCLFFGHKNKNIFPELLKLNILALNLNGQEGIKEKNFVRLTVHSADSLFKNLSEQISKFVKRI